MGNLNKLFPKKEVTIEPISLDFLINDIHSHLIPGIDDGSPDMETTLSLLENFINLGYKKVITTPHIMSDYYVNTPDIILDGLDKVRKYSKSNLKLRLKLAEYNLSDFESY